MPKRKKRSMGFIEEDMEKTEKVEKGGKEHK